MTPFKAYLGCLPSEEKFILGFSGEINLQSYFPIELEISQMNLLEDGLISFIATNITNRIENINGIWNENFLNYNRYNALSILLHEDRIDGNAYVYYNILKVKYSSSTNVEIIAEYSLYQGEIPNLSSAFKSPLYYLGYHISYVEWGYRGESVYKNLSFIEYNEYYVPNFDSKMGTDLYCVPPKKYDIDINTFKQRIAFDMLPSLNNLNWKEMLNFNLNNGKWIVMFIKNGSFDIPTARLKPDGTYEEYNETHVFDGTYEYKNNFVNDITNNQKMKLPYTIIFAPLSNDSSYKTLHEGTSQLGYKDFNLSGLLKYGGANIISVQILPHLNLFGIDSSQIEVANDEYYFHYAFSDKYISTGNYSYYDREDYEVSKTLKTFAFMRYNVIPQMPLKSLDHININDLIEQGGYPEIRPKTHSEVNNIITSINNPYVALHTSELRLSHSDGQSYTFNPLALGQLGCMKENPTSIYDYEGNIHFYLWQSLNADLTQSFLTFDFRDMKKSIFGSINNISQSVSDIDAIKDKVYKLKFGLNINTDYNILYDVNMLVQFMQQNKNFYQQKELQISQDVLSMGLNSQVKGGIKGTYGIMANIENINLQLDNYSKAPTEIKGSYNNIFLTDKIADLGFYLEIWNANDLVKKDILNIFLEKGIFINKFVNSSDVMEFVNARNQYREINKPFKYFKGIIEFFNANAEAIPISMKKIKKLFEKGVKIFDVDHIGSQQNLFNAIANSSFNADNYLEQLYTETDFY